MPDEGRLLTCVICGDARIVDGPVGSDWIDPDLYFCKPCKEGVDPLTRMQLGIGETEWRDYDPRMAAIPF